MSHEPHRPDRPPAVLFMGDLIIVARQARLISEARRRGLAPLLVITPDTPIDRFEACRGDAAHPLSVLDDYVLVPEPTVDRVVPAIQPLLRRFDVRAVLCIGDLFVEPAGLVAECLGLHGPGAGASRISRSKLLQRTAAPGLAPDFRVITPERRAGTAAIDLEFPVVIKPVARFSSLGVRQVHERDELPAILATYPADEILLVESRVVGPEFSVEAFVSGGQPFWAGVTGKETNESGGIYFTEMGHTSPAEIPDRDRQALLDANAELLRAIGFKDGITHAEFRLAGGRPVLMEIATRVPGDGITFLWEMATGAAVEPVMLDLALGLPTSFPEPRRRARQVYLPHPHGRLVDVRGNGTPVHWVEHEDRWPWAAFAPARPDAPARRRVVVVTKQRGDVLGPQTDSEARSASVLLDAPLDVPTARLAAEAADSVTILTEAVDGQDLGADTEGAEHAALA